MTLLERRTSVEKYGKFNYFGASTQSISSAIATHGKRDVTWRAGIGCFVAMGRALGDDCAQRRIASVILEGKSRGETGMSGEPVQSSSTRAGGVPAPPWATLLDRPGAVTIVIVVLWACAVLPSLTARSFIWEEGTNAELARDVLAHGRFLAPMLYGSPWHEKPSLLPWLIAGVAFLTGGVNEWAARLPAMVSVLLTALLVKALTRRYASAAASLLAALCFLFAPLVLQKLTIAEPDTVITLLSFAAFLVWWRAAASGDVPMTNWVLCGLLLAVAAMAKGPQPAGFFVLGTALYLLVKRRWRDLPGWTLCTIMPLAAAIGWGIAVYEPGDEATWLSYARLSAPKSLAGYAARNSYHAIGLFLELLPMTLILPFAGFARPRDNDEVKAPVVVPLLLYGGVSTIVLVLWPGFNSRYAMPIAPALAVLTGIAWDRLTQSKVSRLPKIVSTILGALIIYQLALVTFVMPSLPHRFGASREDGVALERAVDGNPAPVYCVTLDTNQLFYVRKPLRCLDAAAQLSLIPPAWLLIPRNSVAGFAQLRPDLDVRILTETGSGPQLAAVRIDRKSAER